MIFIIGLSISTFIFILLCLKKNKSESDKILAVWMGFMSIHVFLYYLHYSQYVYEFPFLIGTILPLPILHGVFLYFYAKALMHKNAFQKQIWALHLFPFIFLIILAIPFYALSGEDKINVFKNDGEGYEWYSMIQYAMFVVVGFGYGIFTFKMIRNYRKNILDYISNNDKQMLRWLEYLTLGLSIIWTTIAFFDDYIIFFVVTLFVAFIGIYGFFQVPLYFINIDQGVIADGTVNVLAENTSKEEKYKKSGFSAEQTKQLFDRLEELTKREKLYENSDITLIELANRLEVPPNYLSQAINSQTNETFYHYINKYRIEAFIQKIELKQHLQYTILALAYECGFNSKSTFNKYFKNHTGKSPSEYIN